MPEERNRLAPPTRLPGDWLGRCLGLDTHFQRLFSSSRTHQPPPPPLPPNNRRFLSDRADPSHDLSLRHEFLFLALHAFDGKRNTISRPTRRCYLYAGRQLTIKDSRFHETSRLERERETEERDAPTFRRLNNNNDSVESQ